MAGHAYSFTREAAAEYLGIAVSTLDHLSARRQLAFVKLDRRSLYSETDLLAFIESRRVQPEPAKK